MANLASAKAYKGAEIYSNDSVLYGRFEMRMQVAKGSGILSTFFTYKNGSEVGNTFWEEIDIEVFGKNNATEWQSNIILGSSRPTLHVEQVHSLTQSLGDAYHTYVLEWTPDYVAWFLDGVEVRRITGTSTVTSLTNAQSLRFNLWSSESAEWVGPWDPSILPVYQFINYIDYQAYNATTKTFEGGWRDDFNSFDSSRWGKANWSFDTNRVDFAPENVVVKDGILVLAMTTDAALGFSGTPPADNEVVSSSSAPASSSSVASSSLAQSSVAQSSSSETSAAQSSEAASSTALSSSSAAAISSAAASSNAATGSNSGSGGGGAMHGLWLAMLAGLLLLRLLIQIGRARRIHIAL
ncbi:family 16 glycosylhydrolase [Cellvibrio sp. QJXJ]|uniref:family 16 glycosylhydrolase n=1 Tax=Cellvibrio sp. QJXJ TaxID=2964606 RepID=UPI0021C2C377|nr:family 16 glycosylhydrolase [Cellvibrio sp. QJXJ]UUA71685.1 family 16 glycosylhydrolase [Cellvibrio sp. QJXJ]